MPDPEPQIPRWVIASVLVFAILIAFVPTLHAPFLLDDYWRIVGNEGVHHFWPPWRHFTDPRTSAAMASLVQFRPLLPLSFSADIALWGVDRSALRATNVALHFGVVSLTFGLVRELLRHWDRAPRASGSPERTALVIAVLVAIHPIAAYTVNYLSARDLVLAQLGLLATLWGYVRYRRRGPPVWSRAWARSWSAMMIAFAFAMLAKQNVVVLPALLVVFDVVVARVPLRSPGLWLRPLPFVVIIAAWVLWSQAVLDFSDFDNVIGTFAPSMFAFTQAKLHSTEYLAALLWPFRLRYFPLVTPEVSPWNAGTLAGLTLIVLSLGIAWRTRERAPLLSFALCSYWVLMALESSVLPLANWMMPYRQYPALLFVGLGGAVALRTWAAPGLRTPSGRRVLAVSAVAAALGVTLVNSAHWRSEDRFWSHAAAYGADHRAHLNLAASIADPKDPRVQVHLREAERQMVVEASDEMATAALLPGLDDKVTRFEADQSSATDTTVGRVHFWRAHALRESGRRVEARREADRAADAAPTIASYQWYAAMDAQHAEDWGRVVVLAQRLERLDTDPSSLAFLGGAALQNLGRNGEAIDWYLRYLALPSHERLPSGRRSVTMNLALAALAIGRCDLARPALLDRQRERPDDTEISGLLAACPGR